MREDKGRRTKIKGRKREAEAGGADGNSNIKGIYWQITIIDFLSA